MRGNPTARGYRFRKAAFDRVWLKCDISSSIFRASHSLSLWGEQTSRHVMLTLHLHYALQNLIHYLRDSHDLSCLIAFLFLKILLLIFKAFLSSSRVRGCLFWANMHTQYKICARPRHKPPFNWVTCRFEHSHTWTPNRPFKCPEVCMFERERVVSVALRATWCLLRQPHTASLFITSVFEVSITFAWEPCTHTSLASHLHMPCGFPAVDNHSTSFRCVYACMWANMFVCYVAVTIALVSSPPNSLKTCTKN